MSQYHEKCTNEPKHSKKILTCKPFCDCKYCSCDDCPDILKMLSITVTDKTCEFGRKIKENEKPPEKGEAPDTQNLLEILNPDRSCNCEVVARSIHDDVAKNLGMSERRFKIQNPSNESFPEDQENPKGRDPEAKDSKVRTKEFSHRDSKILSKPWQDDSKNKSGKNTTFDIKCDETPDVSAQPDK